MPPLPPVAQKVPKQLTLHGDTRVDNYYWLRERELAETVAYLEAENRYTEAMMAPIKPLESAIYEEIIGRIQQTDASAPFRKKDYYYYSRTEEGKQYSIYCRKRGGLDGTEEILLDGNVLAEGQAYFALGGMTVSENQQLLAYAVDNTGAERFTVQVKDLVTGEPLPDRIPETTYGLAWLNDNAGLLYVTFDATQRPEKVWQHVLGTAVADDKVLFTEDDPLFTFELRKARSGSYIFVTSVNASTTTEVHILNAAESSGGFQLFEPRQAGVEYYVEHQGDKFLIRTNAEGATNFKLMATPLAATGRQHWTPLLPERADVTLEDVEAFEHFRVVAFRERGLPGLAIHDLRSGQERGIEFPETAYSLGWGENPEYRTTLLRFTYESMVTPFSVYDYEMASGTRELKKRTEIRGGYQPEAYQTERVYAVASDGKQIPITLAYARNVPKDGVNPLLLQAYGSYGINSDPHFSVPALSLLDRGFVVATAHVRGGAELGRGWFEDGRKLHKRNTFTDFIACAEYLIAQRYTSREKLAATGGSAGGLLMGAIANMRPDLFHAIVARVPFVDVVTTMLDPSIPLTTGEYDQWGNPEEKIYYDYMKSYSPYDNVQAQAYPNMLVTTGLNDPRVAYWEPAKWVAKLRALKTDQNLLLLKTEMGTGHGGPSGRYERYREIAMVYAFITYSVLRQTASA